MLCLDVRLEGGVDLVLLATTAFVDLFLLDGPALLPLAALTVLHQL